MTAYINTSWDHPHLYGDSKYTHGIQMGGDYVLRVYHGPIMRSASVSITRDGVYCGECGADITGAWRHAQCETDPQPDVVTCGKGQPLTVNEEPVDVQQLLTNHAELVEEHAELGKAYRSLQEARNEVWKYYLEEQEANGDLREKHEELGSLYRDVVQEREALQEELDEHARTAEERNAAYVELVARGAKMNKALADKDRDLARLRTEMEELQEQIAGYDESNTLLSRTVSELQEQLQHTTSEEQRDDTTTDLNRLALRAEGAEYALQSLQLGVAGMAQDCDRQNASPRPDYIAKRLRSMLPPTIGEAWGLAGRWATDRILGDVHVVDAAADDDGEVEVQYLDNGKLVQGYAYVGALANWRTTR